MWEVSSAAALGCEWAGDLHEEREAVWKTRFQKKMCACAFQWGMEIYIKRVYAYKFKTNVWRYNAYEESDSLY